MDARGQKENGPSTWNVEEDGRDGDEGEGFENLDMQQLGDGRHAAQFSSRDPDVDNKSEIMCNPLINLIN